MVIKKGALLLLSVLLLGIYANFIFAAASSLDSGVVEVQRGVNDVNKFFTREDVRTEFIKDKWQKFSTTNPIGIGMMSAHNYLLTKSNFFYLFFGIEYSFSLKFWLAIVFFVTLTLFFFRLSRGLFVLLLAMVYIFMRDVVKKKGLAASKFLKVFEAKSLTNVADFWLFLAFFAIFIIFKIPYFLANMFVEVFSSQNSMIIRIWYFVLVIGGIYLLSMAGGYVNKFLKMQEKYLIEKEKVRNLEAEVEREKKEKKAKKRVDSDPQNSSLSDEDRKLLTSVSAALPRIMRHLDDEDGEEDEDESEEDRKIRKEAEKEAREDVEGLADED